MEGGGSILLIVMAVWFAACAVKAARAVRDGKPYTFALWDLGFLPGNERLTPRGTRLRLVLSVVNAIGCLVSYLRPVPAVEYLSFALIFVQIVGELAMNEQSAPPADPPNTDE